MAVGAVAAPCFAGVGLLAVRLAAGPPPDTAERAGGRPLDPAAWGSDHVGQSPPEYLTGDECLFCHREMGTSWSDNAHHQTIRPAGPATPAVQALAEHGSTANHAADAELVLGGDRQVRFLRRSEAYGRLAILTAAYRAAGGTGELTGATDPHWDDAAFGQNCAGCHTTAVDPATQAFSAISLDCYVCHGDVPLAHTKDTSLVQLSAASRKAREAVSICGQCHLRGGKSRSTGLPYPNNFTAGDNLFRDFEVNWDANEIAKMGAGDRHVFQNARDVALRGMNETTCLSCHDVHAQSTEKHVDLPRADICLTCHVPGEPPPDLTSGEGHSAVCGY